MLSLDGGFWQSFYGIENGINELRTNFTDGFLVYETLYLPAALDVISLASQHCTTTLLDRQTVGPLRQNAAQLAKHQLMAVFGIWGNNPTSLKKMPDTENWSPCPLASQRTVVEQHPSVLETQTLESTASVHHNDYVLVRTETGKTHATSPCSSGHLPI